MKKSILILALLIGYIITACSSDDDTINNSVSEFQGNWSGSYTGDQDNGTWSITVSANGTISGTTTSNVFNDTFTLDGSVSDNGNLDATAGTASSGATFVGGMSANNASGTWNNTSLNINGNWSGIKQ